MERLENYHEVLGTFLNGLRSRILATAIDRGQYSTPDRRVLLYQLLQELGEAKLEWKARRHSRFDLGGKPEGFPVEIADSVIACMSILGWLGREAEIPDYDYILSTSVGEMLDLTIGEAIMQTREIESDPDLHGALESILGRLSWIANRTGIDLAHEIMLKIEYNEGRSR